MSARAELASVLVVADPQLDRLQLVMSDLRPASPPTPPAAEDPILAGSPRRVEVRDNPIVINESVQWVPGTAKIAPSSDELLAEIAKVIMENPAITLLEVQGHTDSHGDRSENMRLSQRRANAVRDRLVEEGVETGRLRAQGYGQEEPIADNETSEGRAANQRIEFRIIEQEVTHTIVDVEPDGRSIAEP